MAGDAAVEGVRGARRGIIGVVDPPDVGTEDVVGEHDAPDGDHRLHRGPVLGVLGLLGIDEDDIHTPRAQLPGQLRQHLQGGAPPDLDTIAHAGALELALGEVGVTRVGLDGYQPSARREPPRNPDARVPGQRAHLDGQPGPGHRGLDHQEPPDLCIDGDIGKPRRHRLSHNPGEVLVLLPEDLITVPPRELPTIRCHLDHDRKSTDSRPRPV